nr:immunoglobulin heavy chain junction region [Macaca mulatta]MOY18720.1 immunoglobulin heavy chain junction region [Macaca mulatta]MOY18721.1 immunoglobulin heavy chain junction region [Macaca mulatta]MOY18841.1 immunoglobulin heavy chain junction region [Macaca mulatta]MOY18935.1 immunoglobulin heavy chain junction region [Macaca mulatta]
CARDERQSGTTESYYGLDSW